MKKMIAGILCLVLALSLSGCGTNAQSSDTCNANYEEGYTAGYEAGYHDGKQQVTGNEKRFAQFSGSFTATVEQLLPDYYALPGKTIAVVHFFQDRPFLLHFQKDLTGELIEGTSYVFEFETFQVELPEDEEDLDILDKCSKNHAGSVHKYRRRVIYGKLRKDIGKICVQGRGVPEGVRYPCRPQQRRWQGGADLRLRASALYIIKR